MKGERRMAHVQRLGALGFAVVTFTNEKSAMFSRAFALLRLLESDQRSLDCTAGSRLEDGAPDQNNEREESIQ